MTKLRPPVSIENTLYRVLGELGIEHAAAATGRAESYLRQLSNPDTREQLTVRDMILLDDACRLAGDPTRPLYTTVGLLLDAAGAERFADSAAIGRDAQQVAREAGEATAAVFAAALDTTGDAKIRDEALRQAEEAHEAFGTAISTLRASRPRDGPPPQPT